MQTTGYTQNRTFEFDLGQKTSKRSCTVSWKRMERGYFLFLIKRGKYSQGNLTTRVSNYTKLSLEHGRGELACLTATGTRSLELNDDVLMEVAG